MATGGRAVHVRVCPDRCRCRRRVSQVKDSKSSAPVKSRPVVAPTKTKSYPAMAVEEARKSDIERSVRFLQRLHDVEGGATQLPTAANAYAAATAKLNAPYVLEMRYIVSRLMSCISKRVVE